MSRALSTGAFLLLAAAAVYGFIHEKLFTLQTWTPTGFTRFLIYTAAFWVVAGTMIWLRPRWLYPFAAIAVVGYSSWWFGPRAPLAVVYLLGSSFLLGKRFLRHADTLAALLLGLATWMFAISFAVHFPVNSAPTYALAFAVPFVLESRRLRDYAEQVRIPEISRAQAWSVAVMLFVLLAHFAVALAPEVSADGLAMHLTIPMAVQQDARWNFDFRVYAWALMPMGGDWLYTAAYLLGGEGAARLLNFSMLAVIAAMIVRATREPLAAALFLSTPMVQLVTGSLFVENIWAALVCGAALALARYTKTAEASELILAAALGGAATASKLGTLAFCVVAAIIGAVVALRRRQVKALAVAMLLFLLLAGPPYLNAWWKTGNPVFPFLNTFFRSPHFDTSEALVDLRFRTPFSWHTLYDLTFRSGQFFEGRPGSAGFQYFLLLIPVLILSASAAGRDAPDRARTLLAVGGLGAALCFAFQPNLRYLYPGLALLSIVFALWTPRLVLVGLIALNLWFLPMAGWYNRDFALLSHRESERYLESAAPQRKLIDLLNRNAPGEPVAFFGGDFIAGLHAPMYSDTWHSNAFAKRLAAATAPEQVADAFRELNIRHVITPPPSEGNLFVVSQFLADWTEPEAQAGHISLLRVLPERRVPPKDTSPPGAGSYDDFDSRIEYSGAWWHDRQFAEAAGGSITYSNQPGDTARFRFAGSAITYVYTRALNRGTVQIAVDGKKWGSIELYSATTLWQRQTRISGLDPGEHVIELRVLEAADPRSRGHYVDLDRFLVGE